MDENYLDNLLKGVSTDNQKKNSFDKNVEKDSTVDIDFSDLDDISLDELDSLDDISLEELDFDDIDFDDVDITNLNSKEEKSGKEYIPEEEDFDADEILEDIIGMDDLENLSEDDTDMAQLDGMDELLAAVMEEKSDEVKHEESSLSPEDIDNLFAELDSEDADEPLDRMENVFAEAESEHIQDVNSESVDSFVDELFGDAGSSDGEMSDIESMDLDDLFSALGIDETEGVVADNYVAGEDDLEQLLQNTMMNSLEDDGLADIADIGDKQTPKKTGAKSKKSAKGPKEKKSVSEILFGAPDEDDEEEGKEEEPKFSDVVDHMKRQNAKKYFGMLDEDFVPHVDAFWYGLEMLCEFIDHHIAIDYEIKDAVIDSDERSKLLRTVSSMSFEVSEARLDSLHELNAHFEERCASIKNN